VVSLLVLLALAPFSSAGAAMGGKLEIFSWWTAGGEAEGLSGMFSVYKKLYPGVEIVNATVAGGAGTNAKAVLATRLTGGDPPDSFQVHAGLEVQKYDPAGFLDPLHAIFKSEGWEKVFPSGLLTLLRYQGHYWSVPVNIHRPNVMWYSKKVFTANYLTPPRAPWKSWATGRTAGSSPRTTPTTAGRPRRVIRGSSTRCLTRSPCPRRLPTARTP